MQRLLRRLWCRLFGHRSHYVFHNPTTQTEHRFPVYPSPESSPTPALPWTDTGPCVDRIVCDRCGFTRRMLPATERLRRGLP